MKRRLRRALVWAAAGFAAAVLFGALWLAWAVAYEPLPPGLVQGAPPPSLRVLDRAGLLLVEVTQEGQHVAAVQLAELPPEVTWAILAAEDQRFFSHPGVDPIAMARALFQAIGQQRIVSGASTITQQLARSQFARPRTWRGKLHEIVVALRIERELSKPQILEAYLNHVDFGPRLRGLEAASRALLDKPAKSLSLAEAALLVGLPRGPSLYDPTRGTERAKRRRDRILGRLREAESLPDDAIERALREPIVLRRAFRSGAAQHFARALAQGEFSLHPGAQSVVRSTLDRELQEELEGLARATVERLVAQDASAAAVLVLDNESAEILAYVGSQDFWSAANLGQNDGVRALRQPGSALKPFVYAAALESRQFSAASVLPDIELHLPTARGDYAPRNYDGAFHGPVRLRTALASSLNVPAVYVTQRLGPARVLDRLRAFGFATLDKSAADYGAALALGDGEVRLLDLARAYLTLAHGGEDRELVSVLAARGRKGEPLELPRREPVRVLSPEVAALVSDVLRDDVERQSGFGRESVLSLPFPVAVKTGTSKGYRDNWAIGSSSAVTVAVWVGNIDGHPMRQSSGVSGAGPLFHGAMLAAMRRRESAPPPPLSGLVDREVCALSGAVPGPACPERTHEHFLPGTEPHEICGFHERVAIVPSTGLRAGPACTNAVVRDFELYPEPFGAWATRAGRPRAPNAYDPSCPGPPRKEGAPRVVYPFDGARFSLDPGLSIEQQRLVFRASPSSAELRFWLDGRAIPASASGEASWPLRPGRHELHAESALGRGPSIGFSVDP